MPPWGRPPGAPADVAGNGRRQDGRVPRPRRLNELDSDDEYEQGYYLDPANFMSRSDSLPSREQDFAGDELYFTGYDLGQARNGRSSAERSQEDLGYQGDYRYMDEDERYYEEQRQAAFSAFQERELVQSANDKMRKAMAEGKTSCNLSAEEIDALNRSNMINRRESSTPSTPSKKKGSRSNSASANGDKSKKKPTRTSLFGPSTRSISRTRPPKTPRRQSSEQTTLANPPASAPPAFVVAGPDGAPMYMPFGYYSSAEDVRAAPSAFRVSSRAASASSRRQVTPPLDVPYLPYPPRYYATASDIRSSDSPLRLPRTRAVTTAPYPSDHLLKQPALPPQSPNRRNVSGPPDFSKLRRAQPSPLAGKNAETKADYGRPPRTDSRGGLGQAGRESSGSSSVDEEDGGEGVRVEIGLGDEGQGWRVGRAAAAAATGSGSGNNKDGTRRRKGRK